MDKNSEMKKAKLLREMKGDLNKWRDTACSGVEKSILIRCLSSPN